MRCMTCGADWETGAFSEDCEECGGGALTRLCPMCEGKCGQTWSKMLIDTRDESCAHWAGTCGLSKEEKAELMRQYIEKMKSQS